MGLFNKQKLSLEEILKAIENLSEEEKAQVKAKMEEPTEEEVSGEEIASETEDNGVETEEVSTEEVATEEEVENQPTEEPSEQPTEPTEQPTPEQDGATNENSEDVYQGLADRITALEEQLAQFSELKELMEQFTQKQADSFGYKGAIPGAKKDIHDMSASELKEKMLNGEI